MGRHPVGDQAMTAAERMRRYRARKKEERPFRERMAQEEKAERRRAKAREWRAQKEEQGRQRWQEWRRREEARSLDPELLRVFQRERHREREEQQRQRMAQEDAHKRQQALMRKLTKVLGMLGSDHEGERAAAARQAEALRKELGIEWDDIVG